MIVEAWRRFTLKAPPIVVRAFKKTNIYPFQPPKRNDDDLAAGACTTAMQSSSGKKSVELEQTAWTTINIQPFTVQHTTKPMTLLRAKGHNSRNLLIRSAAYDFLNKTLLLPSQEIKKVHQEYLDVKSTKVGSMNIRAEDRRTNPDTSRGLWVNLRVLVQASAVHEAKERKK